MILLLALMLVWGSIFTVKAVFPESFWRMIQIAERLSFVYGGVANPAEYFSIESDGRVGMGVIPQNHSVILELKSENKALLVPRVNSVFNIQIPENGMMVYEKARECFRVYQANAWSNCLGDTGSIRVLPQEPTDGKLGDIYYNTTNNTLFIHDGNRFVAVSANFLELTAYNHSCMRMTVTDPSLQVQCPNNKRITSLFYEPATFSHTIDIHTTPEIEAVECCATTHFPFFWHTSEWSQCAGGNQSRSVTCRDNTNNVVDNGLCIAAHQPPTTQNCEEPIIPASWQIGAYGECSRAGVQSRLVTCVGRDGTTMAGQCDPAIKPPTGRTCDIPLNCEEIVIGANHPLDPFIRDGGVTLGSDRITFNNSTAITAFVLAVQPSGLSGVGVVGMENGISSANMGQSATAQAVCRAAGFNNVLSGTDADAWHSPHDNTLHFWNGSSFSSTNAKYPGSNIRKDRKINTLTCVDPFGISVDARCTGGGGTPPPNTCNDTFVQIASHRSSAHAGRMIEYTSSVSAVEKEFSVTVFTEDLNYTIRFMDASGNVIRSEVANPGRDGNNDINTATFSHRAHQVYLKVTEGGHAPSSDFGYTVRSRGICSVATGPSNNTQCDATGKFTIPDAEFNALDGSANSFLRGGNHAFVDWARCDKQVTAASVDNGGIRINFRNPPRSGNVRLTVNTGHARLYRVAHASNISGNLPSRFTSNRTYTYNCSFNGSQYSCNVQ
ncbi:MAG TPA: thrombospondin type-1 domain-containing protein [Candidatus Gracilibacteria bacterium]